MTLPRFSFPLSRSTTTETRIFIQHKHDPHSLLPRSLLIHSLSPFFTSDSIIQVFQMLRSEKFPDPYPIGSPLFLRGNFSSFFPLFRISFPRSSLHFLSNQTEELWHTTFDLFLPLSLSLSSLSSLKCHQEKSHYRVYLHPTPPFILVNLGERKHLPLAFTFLREDSSLSKRILWTITMWFTLDPLFHDFHLFVFPSFHFLYFPSYFPFSYFSFPFFPITPLFPPSFVTISFCTSLVSRREISHSHPFSKKDLTPTWTLHFHSNFCIGVS